MFGIGILELLVIAAILFLLVGVPIITMIVVLFVVNRPRSPKDRQ
jgi:hypothetical protein